MIYIKIQKDLYNENQLQELKREYPLLHALASWLYGAIRGQKFLQHKKDHEQTHYKRIAL